MVVKKGYKQTNVGVIPEDWESVRLGSIASFKSGIGIEVSKLDSDSSHANIPVFGGNGIAGYTTRSMVSESTLVIGRVGQKCGEVYLTNGPAWITDNALFPRALSGKVIIKYLAIALRGAGLNSFKNRNDLPLVTQTILDNVTITLPPTLAEQEAIASVLSDADAWIESLEQLIVKKRQIKQGAMQELLTGKRRLPGFSGKWETKRLGDVVLTDPENLSADTSPDYAFNYVSLDDVDCGRLRSHTEQVFSSAPSRARRKLRYNDVMVSTVRPNLRSHLLFKIERGEWICSTGFCVLRCQYSKTHPFFVLSHFFADPLNRQIETLLTGSSYPAINSLDIKALEMPIPPYLEQTAIATVLSDMDTEIESLESKLAKAREIKQGMMQELLTGRIRLIEN
jgi:type I restriction enzyme S subunit